MIYVIAAFFLVQAAPAQTQPDTGTVAAVPAEAPRTEAVAPVAPAQPNQTERRRPRVATNVVCEDRAPTGSTLRRNICRTENRARAEAQIAREYVAEVTSAAHELLRP